jgi:hypothetical protein
MNSASNARLNHCLWTELSNKWHTYWITNLRLSSQGKNEHVWSLTKSTACFPHCTPPLCRHEYQNDNGKREKGNVTTGRSGGSHAQGRWGRVGRNLCSLSHPNVFKIITELLNKYYVSSSNWLVKEIYFSVYGHCTVIYGRPMFHTKTLPQFSGFRCLYPFAKTTYTLLQRLSQQSEPSQSRKINFLSAYWWYDLFNLVVLSVLITVSWLIFPLLTNNSNSLGQHDFAGWMW